MGPQEIISTGEALGRLGAVSMLGAAVIALGILSWRLWRDGVTTSKESAATYITMLKEQFTDANRRKDLFDDMGKAIDGQAQATRDLRQEVIGLRSDIQRLRP